jgi:hypothetical protein
MTMLHPRLGQSAKSIPRARRICRRDNARMEKLLLAVFRVGGRYTPRFPREGSLPRRPRSRMPKVTRKWVVVLHLRCPEGRLQASSRTLELIDGQWES